MKLVKQKMIGDYEEMMNGGTYKNLKINYRYRVTAKLKAGQQRN